MNLVLDIRRSFCALLSLLRHSIPITVDLKLNVHRSVNIQILLPLMKSVDFKKSFEAMDLAEIRGIYSFDSSNSGSLYGNQI